MRGLGHGEETAETCTHSWTAGHGRSHTQVTVSFVMIVQLNLSLSMPDSTVSNMQGEVYDSVELEGAYR